MVFVHAGIADGRLWDRQVAVFANRYRVVAYDLPSLERPDEFNRMLASFLEGESEQKGGLAG